jgi:hypothetical protein
MCAKVDLSKVLCTNPILTMQATAREAGARFINLDISSLTDKVASRSELETSIICCDVQWYGESQKIAGAVFTLAKKIQPCESREEGAFPALH